MNRNNIIFSVVLIKSISKNRIGNQNESNKSIYNKSKNKRSIFQR
jgi:hypothetical protein